MYIREYLIALFFLAQHPYWFVSVLLRNPIPFPYPYFPNPIPFPPKNIETEVEIRFFRLFPSIFIATQKSDHECEIIHSALSCCVDHVSMSGDSEFLPNIYHVQYAFD